MRELVDLVTGRALALASAPGIDPVAAVAELVALVGGSRDAVEEAWARLRMLALEACGPTLRLAMDLLEEVATVDLREQPATAVN